MQSNTTRRGNGYWDAVILPAAEAIVNSYTDTKVTLRQLFYRLVSESVLRNTRSEYTQLGERTAAARRVGHFPALIDRTREIVMPNFFEDAEDGRVALREGFRLDRTEGQPWSIYLGIEKAGIIEQLRLWFGDDFGIPILPLGGYHSQPFERQIDGHSNGYDRPSVLLYAGDLDPRGEDIQRNFERWTDFTEIERIAMTFDLKEQYDLTEQPVKDRDKYGQPLKFNDPFREKYGSVFQVEVDALDPNVLRDLFRDAISDYWDNDAYTEVMEREAAERNTL